MHWHPLRLTPDERSDYGGKSPGIYGGKTPGESRDIWGKDPRVK